MPVADNVLGHNKYLVKFLGQYKTPTWIKFSCHNIVYPFISPSTHFKELPKYKK